MPFGMCTKTAAPTMITSIIAVTTGVKAPTTTVTNEAGTMARGVDWLGGVHAVNPRTASTTVDRYDPRWRHCCAR